MRSKRQRYPSYFCLKRGGKVAKGKVYAYCMLRGCPNLIGGNRRNNYELRNGKLKPVK